MKRLIAIMLAALTMAAVLSGCGGRMNGIVSTTPNGKVNGGETAITDSNANSGSHTGTSNGNANGSNNGNANSSNSGNAGNRNDAGSGTGAGTQDRNDTNGSAMDDMREAADDMGQAAKDAGRAMGKAITGDNGTGMTGGR